MKTIMKKEYEFDELVINLPDFVLKRLDDENLLKAIESELDKNEKFREEYRSVKSTLGFIEDAEYPVPDEIYFSSLSARINQRIENESQSAERFSVIDLFKKYIKILVPALGIIIIAIFIFSNLNRKDENETATSVEKIETPERTLSENTARNKNRIPELSQNQILTDTVKTEKQKISKKSVKRNLAAIEKIVEDSIDTPMIEQTDDIKDEIFADIFSEEEEISEEIETNGIEILNLDFPDEPVPEEEFEELTPEEQQEIINNLLKSKI